MAYTPEQQYRRNLRDLPALAPVAPVQEGELSKGLRRGTGQVQSSATADVGLAKAFAGNESGAQASLRDARSYEDPTAAPRIRNIDDISSLDDAGDFAAGLIGEQLPILGTIAATGLAARFGAGRLLNLGRKGKNIATGAGSVTGGIGLETGGAFQEQEAEARKIGIKDSATSVAGSSLATGTLAGALEAVPIYKGLFKPIFDAKGVGKAGTRSILKQFGKHVGKTSLQEAGTEALQEAVQLGGLKFVNENRDLFTEESFTRIRDAAIAGGIVGGGLSLPGGVSQAYQNRTSLDDRIEDLESEDELSNARRAAQEQRLIANGFDPDTLTDEQRGEEAIQFSRGFRDPVSSIINKHLKDDAYNDPDFEALRDNLPEYLRQAAQNPEGIPKEIRADLDGLFEDTDALLADVLGNQEGIIPSGEQEVTAGETVQDEDSLDFQDGVFEVQGEQSNDFSPLTDNTGKSKATTFKKLSEKQITQSLRESYKIDKEQGTISEGVTEGGYVSRRLEKILTLPLNEQTRILRGLSAPLVSETEFLKKQAKEKGESIVGIATPERDARFTVVRSAKQTPATGKVSETLTPAEIATFERDVLRSTEARPNRISNVGLKGGNKKALFDATTPDGKATQINSRNLVRLADKRKEVGYDHPDQFARNSALFSTGLSLLQEAGYKIDVAALKKRGDLEIFKSGDTVHTLGDIEQGIVRTQRKQLRETGKAISKAKTPAEKASLRKKIEATKASLKGAKKRAKPDQQKARELVPQMQAQLRIQSDPDVSDKDRQKAADKYESLKKSFLYNTDTAYDPRNKEVEGTSGIDLTDKPYTSATSTAPPTPKLLSYEESKDAFTVEQFENNEGLIYARALWNKIYKANHRAAASRDTPKRRDRLEAFASEFLESFGFDAKIKILTLAEAAKLHEAQGGDRNNLIDGQIRGFAQKKGNGYVIYVDPTLGVKKHSQLEKEIIAHELGHIVSKEVYAALPARQKAAVRKSWEAWAEQYSTDATGALLSKKSFATMLDLMANNHTELDINNLDMKDKAYLYSFEEWFADNVAKWVTTSAKPKTVTDSYFEDISVPLSSLASTVDKTVREFLDRSFYPATTSKVPVDSVKETKLPKLDNTLQGKIRRIIEESTGVTDIRVGSTTRIGEKAVKIAFGSKPGVNGESEAANVSLRYAFRYLMDPNERRLIINTFKDTGTRKQLIKKFEKYPEVVAEIENDAIAAAAYGYQMWRTGNLSVTPRTETLFHKLADLLRNIMGFVSESKQAVQILTALEKGMLKARRDGNDRFVVQEYTRANKFQTLVASMSEAGKGIRSLIDPIYTAGGALMRETKNPALHKLADLIDPGISQRNVEEAMLEARTRNRTRFTDQIHRIYDTKDKVFGARMAEILNDPDGNPPVTNEEKAALFRTYKVFEEMLHYGRKNKLAIPELRGGKFKYNGKEVNRYYPTVYDFENVVANSQVLKDRLSHPKYNDKLWGIHVSSLKSEADRKLAREAGVFKLSDMERTAVAEHIVDQLIANGGLGDIDVESAPNSNTPYFGSINTKSLGWIEKSDLEGFVSTDLGGTITTYIDQVVKRSEYTKRFGQKGEVLEQILARAKYLGATPKQLKQAQKYVDAVMGTLGAGIDPQWHRAQGAVMVYQNVRVLALATITSLVDPVGILVRGDMDSTWAAFKIGVEQTKNAFSKEKGGMEKFAEGLGVVDDHITSEALGWEYGGHFVTGKAKKINDKFFQLIGLQSWTKTTRIMATAGAKMFIEKHASGKFNKHSKRYLEELNLKPEDIKLDEKGGLVILSREADVSAEERARDERVRAGLNRWVNEAILRPNAALRPIWASDPHWMLIFHLKSFAYAFHERILKRAFNEAIDHGNYTPLLSLTVFAPVMMGVQVFRHALQGKDDDDEEFGSALYGASQSSGLFGKYQLLLDGMRSAQYGNGFVGGMAGPTVSQGNDIYKLINGGNQAKWNAIQRALPANNLYKNWEWNTDGNYTADTPSR